jgi:hypothetical protein
VGDVQQPHPIETDLRRRGRARAARPAAAIAARRGDHDAAAITLVGY